MTKNGIVILARRGIIWIGKYAPFIIVAITIISNIEALYAMMFKVYVYYDESAIYYKPISWWIGNIFELDKAWLFALVVLSIGIEACIWNRISIVFLALLLWQKQYFMEHTISEMMFGVVLLLNIIVGILLVLKGIKIKFLG